MFSYTAERLYGQLGQLYGDFSWSQQFFLYASHLMKEKKWSLQLVSLSRAVVFLHCQDCIVHYAAASFMRFIGSHVGLEEGGVALLCGQVEKSPPD